MKGQIGTSTMLLGEKTKFVNKFQLSAIVQAKDILKRKEQAVAVADCNIIEICEWILKYPLCTTQAQRKAVYFVWMELAEAGHLRGVRPMNFAPRKKAT